ncbi:hypothetical protein HMPREF1580_00034 [Gardnerella vaginalis JCP8070]|nr:hypothetical protein HMPREF1580_00034 [Gardnerella vaginalis JCP8070]
MRNSKSRVVAPNEVEIRDFSQRMKHFARALQQIENVVRAV